MKTYKDIERIKTLFLSDDLFDPDKAIEELLPCRITEEILDFILSLYEIDPELYASSVADFLSPYRYLTEKQQKKLKKYIRNYLDRKENRDSYFVYDLFAIATSWEMSDFYSDALRFVENYPQDNVLVLCSLGYIYEHTSLYEVPDALKTFEKVCNDPNYTQTCQLYATFYLYRWTQKPEYLTFLKELIDTNTLDNDQVLRNILNHKENQPAYFAMHEELMKWVEKKEDQ
jgi:hypothetical protein